MGTIISAGSLLVKETLPPDVAALYDPTRTLDKGGVKDLVSSLIQHGGDTAHDSLTQLSRLFFNKATEHGYSTPLSDYENASPERHALIGEFSSKVAKIRDDAKLSSKERSHQLSMLAADYGSRAQKSNIDYMVANKSTAGKMALTGARGNPSQLMQGTFSPLMARDIHNNPIPVPIKHSFAEGLSAAEFLAMSYEGRANVVKTQTSTSEPGYLFKAIAPNLMHEVITINDCGTQNGLDTRLEDKKDVVGRVEVGAKKPITPEDYKNLTMSGRKVIRLRNTMTCEAPEGICQLCYGISSRGPLPEIGQNVGVIAAQSASEKLTQAVLSTKHASNVGKVRDPFKDAQNLLQMSKNFRDEATLATLDGTITKIEKTSLGDKKVFVNAVAHFVPVDQDVTVKQGEVVRQGSTLSTGTVNPVQLVNLRGLGAGRKYYSAALKDAYGVKDMDTRHYDLLAKNLLRFVKVDDPGETSLLPGEIVDVSKIFPDLKKDTETVPTQQAVGKKLAIQILEIVPGTILDKNHVDSLLQSGVDSVKISKSGLQVTPVVKGVGFTKAMDPNWLSRLSFNRITEQLINAAALGHKSPVHGTDPIAPYILGSEFGLGKDGRY
jgi:DNA-directed RNA polymerase subunit beta'